MGNIKHNDELLRVHDDGFDVVFNCDNKHQNGVSYHAEKNGKKTKIDPEYAMAALVKKVSGAGWPADLPVPSAGGYGYTTTEVTDEAELICKRPEADTCESVYFEYQPGLIVGESYEVTVNGVTGAYECFDDDGYPTIGCMIETMELQEPGKWRLSVADFDDTNWIKAHVNLRPGETATFVISFIKINVYNDNSDINAQESYDVEYQPGLIVGESYEVTVNGVTGAYECFDDDGYPTIGAQWSIIESGEHGAWQIYSYGEDDTNRICAYMNLRPGETATFIVKSLTKVYHPVDGKYMPEGGVGWTERVKTPLVCESIENDWHDDYPLRLGDYFRSIDGGENPYKYPFEITAENVGYDDDDKETKLYLYTANDHFTTQQVVIKDQYGNIFMDEPVENWDEYPVAVYGKWLQPGEHYTVIIDGVEYSYAEEEIVHKIDPKYLDTYDAVFICEGNILHEDPVFNLEYGDFQQVQNKLDNGITPKIKVVYDWDTSDDGGTAYATPVAITNIGYAIAISVYIEYDGIRRIEWSENGIDTK